MTKSLNIACSEINAILKYYLPAYYKNRLPKDMINAIENYSLKDYEVKIDKNKSLKEHNFIRDTYVMLASFRVNFWCNSEEEKAKLKNKFKENDKLISKQYDVSLLNTQLVKRSEGFAPNEVNNLPVKHKKESWFSKIVDKIKKIFNK